MKIIFIFLLCVFSLVGCSPQQEWGHSSSEFATLFMGMPVDGRKSKMVRSLEQNGLTKHPTKDCLVGELCGEPAEVYLSTCNRKVWRVRVEFPECKESNEVIDLYNGLYDYFVGDSLYVHARGSKIERVSENELYTGVRGDTPKYQASFYQRLPEQKGLSSKEIYMRKVWFGVYCDYQEIGKYELVLCYDNLFNRLD